MQAIVKQVLSLTSAAEAAKWAEVEAVLAIHSKELSPPEIADIAHHFAVNNQGSEKFWNSLQQTAVSKLGEFNREDLSKLFNSMMIHPYEVEEAVGEAISEGIDAFASQELEDQRSKDPYFITKFINYIQAGLGQNAFRAGPGFMSERFNEENSDSDGESEDVDLGVQTESQQRQPLIQLNEKFQPRTNELEILEEAKAQLAKSEAITADLKQMK